MRYQRLIPVLAACAYFWYYAKTYTEWHFIDSVNLIFHEAGHVLFMFFGEFINVLMGSGFQVLLPALISFYFFKTGQKISAALCLLWVGQNLLNVSVYAGDAINMQLSLLGGDSVVHDWNYLLSSLGILHYTPIVAGTIYILGLLTIITGSLLAILLTIDAARSDVV